MQADLLFRIRKLRLLVCDLPLAVGYLAFAVLYLPLVVRNLLPSVGYLFFGIRNLLFAVYQLPLAGLYLLPGIIQLPPGLRLLVIQLLLRIIYLFLRLGSEPLISLHGKLMSLILHLLLQPVDIILVFIRIHLVFQLSRRINLRQIVAGKRIPRYIKKGSDLPLPDGSGSPLKINVIGGAHNAHSRKGPALKHFQCIPVIVVRHRNPASDSLLPVQGGIQHALIRLLRQSSRSYHHPVNPLRHGMDLVDSLISLPEVTQCIHRDRPFCTLYLAKAGQLLHILRVKAYGGQQSEVKKILFLQIIVFRHDHCRCRYL